VDGDLNRLQTVELPPFRKAIAAGADSVMVAHLAIPALEPDPNKVATVSPNVIQGLLRKQLGFNGVIVTDAMEMRGLTSLYPPQSGNPAGRAAVDAFKAGNDVLLMPSDLDGAYQGVLDAVHRGDITVERLNDSVRRILEMKASVGLNKARLVDLQQVSHIVGRQENVEFAQQVADQAVTMVRNNGTVLPLAKSAPQKRENGPYAAPASTGTQVVTVIISDNARGSWGRALEFAIRSRRPDATVFYVDASTATPLAGVILQAVKDAGKVVVATFVSPTSGKQVLVNGKMTNSVGLQQSTGDLLNQILEGAAVKTVLVAMGNPYLILNFPAVQNYVCSFSGTSSSELSVARVLFGEIQPKGVLPISLPGIADRGMRSLTLAHSAAGQH
jgi:beta-N-acetylhexosaminidase